MLRNTTVGGVPNTELQIVQPIVLGAPSSTVATHAQGWTFWYSDNGVGGIGRAFINAGESVVRLTKADGTAWTASVNNTSIEMTWTCAVHWL